MSQFLNAEFLGSFNLNEMCKEHNVPLVVKTDILLTAKIVEERFQKYKHSINELKITICPSFFM